MQACQCLTKWCCVCPRHASSTETPKFSAHLAHALRAKHGAVQALHLAHLAVQLACESPKGAGGSGGYAAVRFNKWGSLLGLSLPIEMKTSIVQHAHRCACSRPSGATVCPNRPPFLCNASPTHPRSSPGWKASRHLSRSRRRRCGRRRHEGCPAAMPAGLQGGQWMQSRRVVSTQQWQQMQTGRSQG